MHAHGSLYAVGRLGWEARAGSGQVEGWHSRTMQPYIVSVEVKQLVGVVSVAMQCSCVLLESTAALNLA